MKPPRVLISIDNGIVWSVCSDIEVVVIEENLDVQMVRVVPCCKGDAACRKIDDIEDLASALEIDRFEAIKRAKDAKCKK